MKKKIPLFILALASALALNQTKAQDSTQVQKPDLYNGNIELIQGTTPKSNGGAPNSYVRSNTFFGLPADISGYNWTEVYPGGTIFGRNTLTRNIAGKVGIANQFIYGTGMTSQTGLGAFVDLTPTDKTFIRPYFTPMLIDLKGKKVDNTSISGVYAEASINPNVKISGFYEVNLSAKAGPETSYGELNVEGIVNDNISISWNPSFTNNGQGVLAPQMNQRFTVKYTFK